jgi:hypothetical protein
VPPLPDADQLPHVDIKIHIYIDDALRRIYRYDKHGAGRGYTGVKGLHALLKIAFWTLPRRIVGSCTGRRFVLGAPR